MDLACTVQQTNQVVSILPRQMTSLRSESAIPRPGAILRFLPAIGIVAVWTVLMPAAGGFQPRDWYPAALVTLGLLTVAVAGSGRILPDGRYARVALVAFGAYTALFELSVLWSDAPGTALDAANLLLLAFLGAWIVALAPWTARSADVLFGAFALAAAVVSAGTLIGSLDVADLTSRFTDGRYNQPLDYPNTAAAFGFLAAVPALVMASRPDLPVWVKTLMQTAATVLALCALLPQSRGSVLGCAVTLLVLLAVVPFRWRLAFHAALLGGVMALASGPIFDVYDAAAESELVSPALHDAARAIWISTAIAAVAGLLIALAEARIRLREPQLVAVRRAGWAAWGLAALAVLVVAASQSSQISDALSDEWNSLKHPGIAFAGADDSADASRLTDVDPLQRYDYWRVAVGGFRDNPVLGMGAGGFEHRYAGDRRYDKLSKYPHNLTLRVLGDTGLVGLAIFAVFALALVAALLVGWRTAGLTERGVAAAGLGVAVYFFVHGQFDWLEAYPVLAGPALALPFAAAVVRSAAGGAAEPAPAARRLGPILPIAGAVVVGVLGVLLVAPWLAIRWTDRAVETWRTAPAAAYRDLDRAADANPASMTPLLYAGVIAVERGEDERAKRYFERVLDREDHWLAHYELAGLAAERGDEATARRELELAARRNVREPAIEETRKDLDDGKKLSASLLLRRLSVVPLSRSRRLS